MYIKIEDSERTPVLLACKNTLMIVKDLIKERRKGDNEYEDLIYVSTNLTTFINKLTRN